MASSNYGIDNAMRMIKKSVNKPLELIKAVTTNQEAFDKIIRDGSIKIGYYSIRVTEWKFGVTPDQCFNCQKFGHSTPYCTQRVPTCIRCNGKHKHNECTAQTQNYKCANCNGNHAAYSKACPVLNKHVEEKTARLNRKGHKYATQTGETTRNPSAKFMPNSL
jgi:hypothetical protein